MKRILLPTLLSTAALISAANGGAPSPSRQSSTAAVESAREAGGQKNRAATAAATPTVRVVDDLELAKLIRRDARQTRPLLVNFWATWCEPCRAEFPDLVRIDEQFRPRGLDFLTVSLDDAAEATKNVPEFLREMRAERIPAYLLNAAEPEAAITAVDKEWRGELPATFLFDGRGRLVFKHAGRVKPDELRAAVEKVLRGSAE